MQVSQKTQKIIAIICGLLFLGVVVAILVSNYRKDAPNDLKTSADNSQQTNDIDTTDKALTTEDTKPVTDPKPETPAKAEPKPPTKTDKETPSKDFSFTAKPGDSYTVLAYNAVQKHVSDNKLTVTEDQQQKAAAILAANAGSPWLEIGQVVIIKQSDISVIIPNTSPAAPQKNETKPDTSKDIITKTDTAAVYSYTAVSGDSYSKLARRAITEFAASNKLDLSPSQRIAAETSIIAASGFPAVNVGQVVTYSGVSIKDAVAAAQMLSEAQLSNWAPYAVLAGL